MTSQLTATGNLEIPLKLAADLIAASAAFQALVSAGNAAAALASIYEGEAIQEELPRALIEWSDRELIRHSHTNWTLDGLIAVLVEKQVDQSSYEQGYQDEGRTFRNEMGAIESDMLSALIASPHLYPNIIGITGPWIDLPDPDNREGKFVFSGWLGLKVLGSAL